MSCAICGKPVNPAYRPFCSRRCADIDLGRWLTESYRIPVENGSEPTDPEGELPPPTDRSAPH